MAQLTINQCQNCGKILAPGITECGKCHTKHAIQPTVVNPLRFTAAQVADYRTQFQEQVTAYPKDFNAQFAMGLTYLGLKNYELADQFLTKAVKLTPSNPDVYYYTALSLFHHRSVMNLSKAEMNRIEEWLNTAVQMQPKRKYLILQMILRQGMSSMGVNVDTDKLSPAELMNQARQTVQEEDEMIEIEQHVLITDEKTQILLDKLANPEDDQDDDNQDNQDEDFNLTTSNKFDPFSDSFDGRPFEHKKFAISSTIDHALEDYDDFCNIVRVDDNYYEKYAELVDEDVRKDFISHIHIPQKPYYSSKPGYLQPLWRTIWTGGVGFIIWIIVILLVQACNLVTTEGKRVPTVEQRMENLNTKKMTKRQIKEAKEKAEFDYAEELADFEKMHKLFYYYYEKRGNTPRQRYYSWPPKTEEEASALPMKARYFGIHKGWTGWLGVVLFLLVPVIWLISSITRFVSRAQERSDISIENKNRKKQYEYDCAHHRDRPTIADYKAFCALFAGPNNVSCVKKGDFVQEALRQAHISEKDVQNGNGKIFFSCYFMDTDDDGNDTKNPATTLRDMLVRVCVAMRDSIVFIHGIWDTTSDYIPKFDQERLLYSQIANFRNVASYSTLEVISHSNNVLSEIIYAYGSYPSIFQYQGIEPKDKITYSNTRTSDFNEFYNSLIKMHAAYCKS